MTIKQTERRAAGRRARIRMPSPTLAISLVSLFVALGGTSYAALALPKNSVGTKQLRKGAVTGSKLQNGAVTASKINFSGLTVPSANHAKSATSATNAANLGDAPASAYARRPQWALVASSGTVLTQSGGITVNTTYASSGLYYVNFGASLANRPVSLVLHYADGGLTGDSSASPCGGSAVPGGFDCSSVSGVNDADHLLVRTMDNTGNSAPFGFYVSVGR